MLTLNFNMAETLAIAIIVLLLGREVKKRVAFLERFFIPAPVVGGVIFSILLLIGHNTGAFSFNFDGERLSNADILYYNRIYCKWKTIEKRWSWSCHIPSDCYCSCSYSRYSGSSIS